MQAIEQKAAKNARLSVSQNEKGVHSGTMPSVPLPDGLITSNLSG
jgi:hypothetical protein